ncbi:hypothetical protein IFR05_007773 [Cadophora sp. M221]|nr:hypothetical protein IFR05_007773 [Cadophora sp. M221]
MSDDTFMKEMKIFERGESQFGRHRHIPGMREAFAGLGRGGLVGGGTFRGGFQQGFGLGNDYGGGMGSMMGQQGFGSFGGLGGAGGGLGSFGGMAPMGSNKASVEVE